jgi:quercetin dioxygenase-like cupin family protein
MGAYSPEDIPMVFEAEGVGWVRQTTENGVVIELSHFEPGVQIDELFHGLPGDRCQCPHSGYVLEGEFVYRTAEGEIVLRAGQAYHIPPGHLPGTRDQACTLVEFSPADAMAETLAVVERNMAAAEAS